MNQLALSKYFAILSGVPGEKKPLRTKQKRMSRYKCNEKNSNINPANEKCISVDARGHMRSVKIYEWGNALSQMYKWQRFGERFKTLWKKFQQASTSRTNTLSQIWCLGGFTVAHLTIWGDDISGDNTFTIPASAEKKDIKICSNDAHLFTSG